jgi:hypothetical protein
VLSGTAIILALSLISTISTAAHAKRRQSERSSGAGSVQIVRGKGGKTLVRDLKTGRLFDPSKCPDGFYVFGPKGIRCPTPDELPR